MGITGRISLFAVSAPATIAACEAPPPGEAETPYQIEDSADVIIVENARPMSGSRLGWQVSPEPSLSIGTAEGTDDFQLHRVDDALKLSDGRIVVANAGSHQLLVFDGNGDFLTAWGQRGEGPGDFGGSRGNEGLTTPFLFWMERWPGDSLAVCHAGSPIGPKQFVSIWDTQGLFGRRLNLALGSDVPTCRDVLASGAILASRRVESPGSLPVMGMNRPAYDFVVLAGDGSRDGALGRHPGAETFSHWEDAEDSPFMIMRPPFQKSLVWVAWGELVVVAPTERYELRAYRQDGSLARIVRRENDVRSPTQADLDGYRAAEAPEGELTRRARNRLAAWNALPLAESFPAISAIEVDLLDNLWVREYNLPGEEGRALWTIFDPEGLVLGFVETPPELIIYEIGGDYILGKVRDELGVEYVQVRGLERSG